MQRRLVTTFFLLIFCVIFSSAEVQKKSGPQIDVVFCMDLSSSSNGLIEQFRNHLWDYWYFFNSCDPKPDYRIGVVAYARPSYGKSNGYSKVIRDLGIDFERMSNTLFKISPRVEKGDQFVGAALNTCLNKISWSKNPDARKIIFLVGNGDVYTGKENLEDVIGRLNQENIQVYSIYCTAPGERKAILGWQKIAQKCGGKIYSMSLRNQYFDELNGFDMKKFRRLNRKFNNTYLYYGKGGRARWKMLQEEDNHIYIANTEGYRFRSMYKISPDYQKKHESWDLVDLQVRERDVGEIDRRFVNDTCKKMSDADLRTYILLKKYERKKLSGMISRMLSEKATKDKYHKVKFDRKVLTLDLLSLRVIKDVLREEGCNCLPN